MPKAKPSPTVRWPSRFTDAYQEDKAIELSSHSTEDGTMVEFSVGTFKRKVSIWLTQPDALSLAYRLLQLAKGQGPC